MSLFRKQAIDHQHDRLAGNILLVQPLSLQVSVAVVSLIVAGIISFLILGEYTRKETVRGFLVPEQGIIKSYASQGGTITRLWVKEGEEVTKGQTLVSISTQNRSPQGRSVSAELVTQLNIQLRLLNEEIEQNNALKMRELQHLSDRQNTLEKELRILEVQHNLSKEKRTLLEQQHTRLMELSHAGHASALEKERHYQSLLDARQAEQNAARLLMQQHNYLAQLDFEQQRIPQQYALTVKNLKRQQTELSRQLTQIENQYDYRVTASHDGIVTGIQVVEGETLKNNKPLLHILPKHSRLVAELLVPTRSAGLVNNGDTARLRFDAFPYQRFGSVSSQIVRIDKAVINPGEITLPILIQEPVYRLRARLEAQQINTKGNVFALRNGLLFEADILLEKRTLAAWLLEPLLSVKGRMG